MSNSFRESRIETFVKTYLTKFNRLQTSRSLERKFIRKAVALIQQALGIPCCDDVEATIDFGTNKDNQLTTTISALLIHIDKRRHRQSLLRAINLLNKAIADPCCGVVPDEIVPDQVSACSEPIEYSGNSSFPRIVQVLLGAGTGNVNFDFNAFNIPDKFIVVFDGVEVINTGYRGNNSYQGALSSELISRGLSSETIAGIGAGSANFVKGTATEVAYVYVYAPLNNTQWEFTLDCPE